MEVRPEHDIVPRLEEGLLIISTCHITLYGPAHAVLFKIWVLDKAWGQDGWILTKFYFACLWDTLKTRGQFPAILIEQASSIKALLYDTKTFFILRDVARNPEHARYRHLAHCGSQSHHRIWFILPAQWGSQTYCTVTLCIARLAKLTRSEKAV